MEIKRTLENIGFVVGGCLFVATHPAIGVLAQPILAVKALYHLCNINYHWRHSRDSKGNDLTKKEYMSKNKVYEVTDLVRLQHETKRLEHNEKMLKTLEWMRGLAKCIIPVIGLIWATNTEFNPGGSAPMCCAGCEDHDSHWTAKDAVKWHQEDIKNRLRQASVTDYTKVA